MGRFWVHLHRGGKESAQHVAAWAGQRRLLTNSFLPEMMLDFASTGSSTREYLDLDFLVRGA